MTVEQLIVQLQKYYDSEDSGMKPITAITIE